MKKKPVMYLILICLIAAMIYTFVYNIINNSSFWSASVTQVLTLFVAIGVAFWATNYKTDERKCKEHAEEIIIKLQQLINNERAYKISAEEDYSVIEFQIHSTNRKLSNYISILKEYAKQFAFTDQIDYISNEFDKYRNLIDNHITDRDYLSKSQKDLKTYCENIDSKCYAIILSLYN